MYVLYGGLEKQARFFFLPGTVTFLLLVPLACDVYCSP